VNIFVILLLAVFMAGYYFMDAPDVQTGQTRAEAAEVANLKSVLACVLQAHSEALILDEQGGVAAEDEIESAIPCAARYEISTRKICADEKRAAKECVPDKVGKITDNYIITTTGIVSENGAGKTLELLGRDYPYAANFGIIQIGEDKTPYIMSSGGTRREISKVIAKEAAFEDGQLAYITQYAVAGKKNPAVAKQLEKIRCKPGEMQIYRQNKWACAGRNAAPVCSGDYIWNADAAQCVPDASRRPICVSPQTAVMTDGVWTCVAPAGKPDCPANQNAEMNYETMQWECVAAAAAQGAKKCDRVFGEIVGGGFAGALRGRLVSCNDCEQMIVKEDCSADCVPNPAAAASRACYAGNCAGDLYFGFPDARYVDAARANIPELAAAIVPIGAPYSKNRRFNCIECPAGIDEVASARPYVIVCR
jgi:hypothetical protein